MSIDGKEPFVREQTQSASMSIIHGGGHIARQKVIRPKARLFGFLSVIWLPLTAIGSMVWWTIGADQLPAAAWLPWLCGLIIALQPVFIALSLAFLFFERPRRVTVMEQYRPPNDSV